MWSERVRHRLEQLHRDAAQPAVSQSIGTPEIRLFVEPVDPLAAPATAAAPLDTQPPAPSDTDLTAPVPHGPDAWPGEVLPTAWGDHLLMRRPLSVVWPNCVRYLPRRPGTDISSPLSELQALSRSFPQATVLLDLETCGFAGTPIFLIGLLHWHDNQLTLSQLWARDYAEEKAILQSMWTILAGAAALVTFNGKSFDWPQVHDRSTLHHLGQRNDPSVSRNLALVVPPRPDWHPAAIVPAETDAEALLDNREPFEKLMQPSDLRPDPLHVDVLHHARRRWRGQLPNCRLQTLERYICGRHRTGDLPGSEIPTAYHDYVRTGNLTHVPSIVQHNALDLVTLLQLTLVLVREASR